MKSGEISDICLVPYRPLLLCPKCGSPQENKVGVLVHIQKLAAAAVGHLCAKNLPYSTGGDFYRRWFGAPPQVRHGEQCCLATAAFTCFSTT